MSAFDNLLRDLVKDEKTNFRNTWSQQAATVVRVTGNTAVCFLLGGETRALRYPAGVSISPGDRVFIAVKGSSAMYISGVLA